LGISVAFDTASDTAGNFEASGGTGAPFSVGGPVVNNPPVLDPIGDQTVAEGELLSFTVSASDPDSDNVTITVSNRPDGATFDGTTFSWTPTVSDIGTFTGVQFTATDDGTPELSDSETITITVTSVIELLCDAMPLVFMQMDTFGTTFGVSGPDFDGDLIPELAALHLVDVAACNGNNNFAALAAATQTAYDVNLILFDSEAQASSVQDFRELIAVLMLLGQDTEAALLTILADNGTVFTGNYENVSCIEGGCFPALIQGVSVRDEYLGLDESVRADVSESYNGIADPDGDTLTNLAEFDNTIANEGTFLDYALAALDATADGTSPVSLQGGGGGGGGSCFIATAAYGTPLAQEIDTLRLFRDESLLQSAAGRAFVDSYYRASPPVARFVAAHPVVADIVRFFLLPVIAVLNLFFGLTAFHLIALGAVASLCAVYLLRVAKRRKARFYEG